MSKTRMDRLCRASAELGAWSFLPMASPSLCSGLGGDPDHYTPQLPALHSFSDIASMAICSILLLPASPHCPAAGDFVEDC